MEKLFLTNDNLELFLRLQKTIYNSIYRKIYNLEPRRVNIRIGNIDMSDSEIDVDYTFCTAVDPEVEYIDTLSLTLKELNDVQ